MSNVFHDNATVLPDGTITQATSLVLPYAPTVEAVELDSIVDVNSGEQAVVEFDFTSVYSTGSLAGVEIWYKLSSATDYRLINTFRPIYPDDITFDEFTVKASFFLPTKEVDYDFLVKFKDANGNIGRYDSNEEATVTITTVTLNGVADLSELHEVISLEATNATEGGMLITDSITLKWIDLAKQPRTFFGSVTVRDGYTGTMHALTFEMAQRIVEYWIYMFVSDTEAGSIPTAFYPRGEAGWYLVKKTTNAIEDVRVPRNKWVSFWVGFSMSKTSTQITQTQYEF